jgi:hypothetical protein
MTRYACALLAVLSFEQVSAEDVNMTGVARINSRFANGVPSNNLDKAGVVLRIFDNTEGPGDGSQKWMPCTQPWCLKFSDRWSTSVINAHDSAPKDGKISLFSGTGGFILAPSVELLCSYSGDGGTMSRYCSKDGSPVKDCVPGCECNHGSPPSCKNWCDELGVDYNCAFKSDHLDEMIKVYRDTKSAYNELVIAAGSKWISQLPSALDAAFFIGDDDCTNEAKKCEGIKGCADTRDFHAAFLKQFGITSEECPLLCMNRNNFQSPFVDVSKRYVGRAAVANMVV